MSESFLKYIVRVAKEEEGISKEDMYRIIESVYGKSESDKCQHTKAYDFDRGEFKREFMVQQEHCYAEYECPDCNDTFRW